MAQRLGLERVDGSSDLPGSRGRDIASVLIRIPADKDYVVIVRSAVGQLCGHLGYSLAEISDLRLAVDEACGLLLGRGGSGDLECRVRVEGETLRIAVTAAEAGTDGPDPEGFGWNILSALVDTLDWTRDGAAATVELAKRRGTERP